MHIYSIFAYLMDSFEHVMTNCWSTDPCERPTFSKISNEVEAYKSTCPDSTGYYAPA